MKQRWEWIRDDNETDLEDNEKLKQRWLWIRDDNVIEHEENETEMKQRWLWIRDDNVTEHEDNETEITMNDKSKMTIPYINNNEIINKHSIPTST